MPGLVRTEASSTDNPILPFFYQEDGLMRDVAALRFEVYSNSTGALKASGVVNLLPSSSGGHRLSTGYYVAPLAPSVLNLEVGPCEIIFYFRTALANPERAEVYFFEILDPKHFRISSRYVSYAPSSHPSLDNYKLEERQQALRDASREVERLTGRIFFPKYMEMPVSVQPKSKSLWIDQPLVGINGITIEQEGIVTSTLQSYDLDTSSIKVFNRHLSYVLSPDDRQNPKITFADVGSSSDLVGLSYFPRGDKNVKIKGVFGYTDPDGSPIGEVPKPLQDVVVMLAAKALKDPLAEDIYSQASGRIKKAKTRDQEIQFDTSAISAYSADMTGDARIDSILLAYCRPPHVGAAG
jgi:hypothetical protein